MVKSTEKMPDSSLTTKDRIKKSARHLITQQGVGDVSYGDIAKMAGTTPANVHYHFGNKDALVEIIFCENAESVEQVMREIWLEPELTLDERIVLVAEYFRQRFHEFNNSEQGRHPWSMNARAQFEGHRLSPAIQSNIAEMSRRFEKYSAHAVKLAIGNGELRPDTPIRNIVLLLAPLWYFGPLLTQHSGLKRLMNHYDVVREVIQAAYGTGRNGPMEAPGRIAG